MTLMLKSYEEEGSMQRLPNDPYKQPRQGESPLQRIWHWFRSLSPESKFLLVLSCSMGLVIARAATNLQQVTITPTTLYKLLIIAMFACSLISIVCKLLATVIRLSAKRKKTSIDREEE